MTSAQRSWHSRLSVNEECAGPLSFDEEVSFWKQLGVCDIGMISTKLAGIGWDADVVKRSGLRVSNVATARSEVWDALEFGAAVGADSVWFNSGGIGSRRLWEEAAEEFSRDIAPLVERAKEVGMPLAVQPTNPLRCDINFLFTLRDAIEIARAADIGVVLELQCCWYERGLRQLIHDNVDLLTLVQINDYKIGTVTTRDRAVVGDGDMPLERIFGMILDAGYQGKFDLEISGPAIEAEGFESATRRSLERASELLDRLGA